MAKFRTFPSLENQVSVQPPMSLILRGVEEWITLRVFLLFFTLIIISFFESARQLGGIYHRICSQASILGIKIPEEKIEKSGKTHPQNVRKKH